MRETGVFRAIEEYKHSNFRTIVISRIERLDRTRRAWAEDQVSGLWENFTPLFSSYARTKG